MFYELMMYFLVIFILLRMRFKCVCIGEGEGVKLLKIENIVYRNYYKFIVYKILYIFIVNV